MVFIVLNNVFFNHKLSDVWSFCILKEKITSSYRLGCIRGKKVPNMGTVNIPLCGVHKGKIKAV